MKRPAIATTAYDHDLVEPVPATRGKPGSVSRATRRYTGVVAAPPPERVHPAIQRKPVNAARTAMLRQLEVDLARGMGFFDTPTVSAVQLSADADSGLSGERVREVAGRGITGSGGPLPHLDAIQRSFGPHDVSGVSAHFGAAARDANQALGAHAYAMGNHVAFSEGSPSLFLAAHEAAHVVQQRSGVHLASAVGQPDDPYEQHADAVAERVVRGQSAADLLGPVVGSTAPSTTVARSPKDKKAPSNSLAPVSLRCIEGSAHPTTIAVESSHHRLRFAASREPKPDHIFAWSLQEVTPADALRVTPIEWTGPTCEFEVATTDVEALTRATLYLWEQQGEVVGTAKQQLTFFKSGQDHTEMELGTHGGWELADPAKHRLPTAKDLGPWKGATPTPSTAHLDPVLAEGHRSYCQTVTGLRASWNHFVPHYNSFKHMEQDAEKWEAARELLRLKGTPEGDVIGYAKSQTVPPTSAGSGKTVTDVARSGPAVPDSEIADAARSGDVRKAMGDRVLADKELTAAKADLKEAEHLARAAEIAVTALETQVAAELKRKDVKRTGAEVEKLRAAEEAMKANVSLFANIALGLAATGVTAHEKLNPDIAEKSVAAAVGYGATAASAGYGTSAEIAAIGLVDYAVTSIATTLLGADFEAKQEAAAAAFAEAVADLENLETDSLNQQLQAATEKVPAAHAHLGATKARLDKATSARAQKIEDIAVAAGDSGNDSLEAAIAAIPAMEMIVGALTELGGYLAIPIGSDIEIAAALHVKDPTAESTLQHVAWMRGFHDQITRDYRAWSERLQDLYEILAELDKADGGAKKKGR